VEQVDFINLLHLAVIENFNNGNLHLSHLISYTLDYLVDSGVKRVNDVSHGLSEEVGLVKDQLIKVNLKGLVVSLVNFRMSKSVFRVELCEMLEEDAFELKEGVLQLQI
jgi:hypothetical protein